jgi:aspartyl protease family protein
MWLARVLGFAIFAALAPGVPGQDGGLRAQVRELAAVHGFKVEGLYRLGDQPARPATGALARQLEILLAGYNYTTVRGKDGISRLVIGSTKRAAPLRRPKFAVNTERQPGGHHLVDGVLVGRLGRRQRVTLLVDTGASTVVLPHSMMEPLGFRPEALENGIAQTANGKVAAKVGVLTSVIVGAARADDVRVTFVPDRGLSANKLLGMSFLERFRVTIDDAGQRLILVAD